MAAFGLAMWIPEYNVFSTSALRNYGAIILSFVGAIHWGIALGLPGTAQIRRLSFSVIPPLYAWSTFILPDILAIVALGVGFISACWFDVHEQRQNLVPIWYLRLRLPLTAAVILILINAGIATFLIS